MSASASGTLTATGRLTRLALRRDRVTVPVSALALAVTVLVSASAMQTAYPTAADRAQLAQGAGTNAAFLVLLGPFRNPASVASTTAWRVGLFMVAVAGVLAALAVVRHTRGEEEAGRLELVRSTPVGRLSPLGSGVLVGSVLSGAVAVVMTLVLLPSGDTADDVAGAVAFGAQFLGIGLASVGVGAVCAQVAATARTARTLALAVLVGGYALRGVGDVQDDLSWLVWLSPVGWAERMDAYGANAYGPFVLCVLLGAAGVALAAVLSGHRDLGAGLVAPRPGPAASASLGTVGALVTRLQWASVAAWALTAGLYCFVVGCVLESADSLLQGNAAAQQYVETLGGAGKLQDTLVAVVMSFVGTAAAAFGVSAATQAHGEETRGRTELVLATGTSRARYLAAWTSLVVAGVVVLLAACGLLMGVGHAVTGGTWGESLVTEVAAAAVQAPAALVVGGVALVLYGWRPRLVGLGWALVVAIVLVVLLGSALHLPQWVLDLSPFTHVPAVPVDDVDVVPLAVLLGVALILGALAFVGFCRREVGSA
ncbi:ABC transporter permease [Luteimicrobium subarcticum]|uniref:ABC-2 type transport system permease protein n=1 Tax=Luteimicrobium subarcticum TaxID=620910 RepID=A0A2M8W6N2_9MICO|nr:ABC transporter permease [Luteimicrobium subarcticum]PJI86552.1 ABC-2 type transport system permease protein [Luteimicrobium subarcticum]